MFKFVNYYQYYQNKIHKERSLLVDCDLTKKGLTLSLSNYGAIDNCAAECGILVKTELFFINMHFFLNMSIGAVTA